MKAFLSSAVLAALCLAGCSRGGVERVSYPVMGTVASVQTRDAADIAALESSVKDVFGRMESLLNRFDPRSEINRLASLSDDAAVAGASPSVRKCYETAFLVSHLSGGAFSPRWRGKDTLDLGAIAKGYALDLAKADYLSKTASSEAGDALLDLGGNLLSCRGTWTAGVKSPEGDGFSAVVELGPGEALATSASYFRGGHIRDGRTGGTVSNGVSSVTVLSRSAMWADALSTVLFILGPEEGKSFLAGIPGRLPGGGRGLAVLWIMSDGEEIRYGAGERFLPR